ncbi:YheC/YheD family endospore coat-associated protein [Salipaludibacillus keqinensis]|uniref:YheC/YheD family endospore coat-associated protein n=1 Tax=Salipaludibacillus keqinensis TaxID=2045207 RepID=UPI001304FB29|nr:YheC/YheD family protein [Salipaludibacillus keqinensis]
MNPANVYVLCPIRLPLPLHIIYELSNGEAGDARMEKIPLIGIMVLKRNQRRKLLKKYDRFKWDLNIELFSFTPKDIDWKKKRISGGSFEKSEWITKNFPFPDGVYNRCYRKQGKTIQRLEKYIGEKKCFNCITYFNKWKVYKLLTETSLKKHLPGTRLYDPEELMKQLRKNKHLILKPCYGYQGKHIYLLEVTDYNEYKIYQNTLKPRYTYRDEQSFSEKIVEITNERKYLIQEKINFAKADGKFVDIRMLVQKNRNGDWGITNGISRIAFYSFFITNCSEKIVEMNKVLSTLFCDPTVRNSVIEEIHQICITASQALEAKTGLLGETGIDLAIDESGSIWIIEVNGKIQKSMYHLLVDKDSIDIEPVYKKPLEYAYYLSHQ